MLLITSICILDNNQPATHTRCHYQVPCVDNTSPLMAQSTHHDLTPHTPDLSGLQLSSGQPRSATGGAPGPGQWIPEADDAWIPGDWGQPHGHDQSWIIRCGLPGQHGPGQEGQHLATAGRVHHVA